MAPKAEARGSNPLGCANEIKYLSNYLTDIKSYMSDLCPSYWHFEGSFTKEKARRAYYNLSSLTLIDNYQKHYTTLGLKLASYNVELKKSILKLLLSSSNLIHFAEWERVS